MKNIFVFTLLVSFLNCSSDDVDKTLFEFQMNKEVKKTVQTIVYDAITIDGKIVNGEIISYTLLGADELNSYTTDYYDGYDNVIFSDRNDEASQFRHTKKINYYDVKEQKIEGIYEKKTYKDGDISYTKTIYKRDNNGNLLNRVTEYLSTENNNWAESEKMSCKYDFDGNRIQEVYYKNGKVDEKKIFTDFKDGKPQIELTYNNENKLIKELRCDYLSEKEVVEKKKHFKFNQMNHDEVSKIKYNDKGKIVEIISSGRGIDGFLKIPEEAIGNEDDYIKKTYYGNNLKLTPFERTIKFIYDTKGNLIEDCLYRKNNIPDFLGSSPCRKVATYEYNVKGDWIRSVAYYAGRPLSVITRKIEYFE